MKNKHIIAHMRAAYVYANVSYCTKLKVGAMVVKNNTPISIGYNGTPSGDSNVCENHDGKTKSTVIHAEDNALRKLVRSSENSIGASLFITHAPCINCTQLILDAEIETVYYCESYRDLSGVKKLINAGVNVIRVDLDNEITSAMRILNGELITTK